MSALDMAHFGDPCIHCGAAHDDFPAGPCKGDPAKARIIRYGVIRQAWQNPGTGCVDIVVLMSTGQTRRESYHPSYHWTYSDRFKDAKAVSRDDILTTEAANERRLSAKATGSVLDAGNAA